MLSNFSITFNKEYINPYAESPKDPLKELSVYELGIRQFCYEHNLLVMLNVGDKSYNLYLNYDICSLLEDDFEAQILNLERGHNTVFIMRVNPLLILLMSSINDVINCQVEDDYKSTYEVQLDKHTVLEQLKNLINEINILARDLGYIL